VVHSDVSPRILILMADQGGGHRAAAQALTEAIRHLAGGPIEVEMVDFIDLAGPMSSARLASIYRMNVNYLAPLHVAVWRIGDRLPGLTRAVVQVLMPRARPRLRELVRRWRPCAVISVYPLANHETVRALAALDRRLPLVTVVTDLGRPPAVWFAPGLDLYIVPCEGARGVALDAGVAEDKVRVLGLPLGNAFLTPVIDSGRLRGELGLNDPRRMVLIVGGGEGMGRLESIARAIAASRLDVQLVIVAGRNDRLRQRLEQVSWGVPTSIHGFVNNMPALMRAADVIVTKAGPHTVMEAMTVGCPVILSGFVPPQEEGVVRLVLEAGAGVLATTPGKVVDALRTLLRPDSDAVDRMVANARRLARPTAALDIARTIFGMANIELANEGRPGNGH
jgi:1,2-diacylglycerol 3-beta-galactosyltransferase